MTTLPPLYQKILLDASTVPAAVATTTTGLKEVGAAADVAKAKTLGLGATFMTLGKSLLAIGGITALATALNGIRQEVIDVEVQSASLEGSLNNIGVTAASQVADITAYADSFEQLGFAGSDAIKGMQVLVTATGDVEQSQKLMALAADYARKKQVPLSQAALIMSRATTGAARAFTQFGITLDKTIPKNEAIAKAFDELNAKIGGTAVKYTETFAGRMAVLRETFENFLESAISPLLPYLTRLGQIMINVATYIKTNAAALKVYAGLILVITAYLKGMAIAQALVAATNPFTYLVAGVVALGAGFVYLWNKFTIFRETMAEALATIIHLISTVILGFSGLMRLLSKAPKLGFLAGVADSADSASKKLDKVAKKVNDLKNAKINPPNLADKFDFVTPGDKTGIKGNAKDTKGGSGGKGTVQYVTVYASDTNDIAKKMSKAAKNGLPVGGR